MIDEMDSGRFGRGDGLASARCRGRAAGIPRRRLRYAQDDRSGAWVRLVSRSLPRPVRWGRSVADAALRFLGGRHVFSWGSISVRGSRERSAPQTMPATSANSPVQLAGQRACRRGCRSRTSYPAAKLGSEMRRGDRIERRNPRIARAYPRKYRESAPCSPGHRPDARAGRSGLPHHRGGAEGHGGTAPGGTGACSIPPAPRGRRR